MTIYSGYTALRIDVSEHIASVAIDNGEINLFDRVLFPDLARAATELAADDDVRVVVLRSANPDFFIAHFDVELILRMPTDMAAPDTPNSFHVMVDTFRTMPKATIAVLEGRVGGGGAELLASFDMRFAARGRAILNQPEVALGILPGGSGTIRLPRLLGRSRALEVILGCDDVDADLAERWGWVNRTFDPSELWPFVHRLAARIAGFPPQAVAAAKASVLDTDGDLTGAYLREGARFNALLGEPSAHGAMASFLEHGGQTRSGELRLGALLGEL